MNKVIFREYDIRGKVGIDFLQSEVYDLGCAIIYFLKKKNPLLKTIAIGMDGRIHSPDIKQELTKACIDSGMNVVFIGLCHSPGLYFAMHTLPVDAGLMITASHNPKEYNGIKICLGKESIWGDDIREIYQVYEQHQKVSSAVKGTYREQPIVPLYVDHLVDLFPHLKNSSISAVIDCGNGAAGTVIPLLLEKMNWQQVQLMYCEVDGTYPHHEADPIVYKNMEDVKQVLETTNIQLGIGFDGDADRMAPMTKSGRLVSGDLLVGLFAQEMIKTDPGLAVVFDVKASSVLIDHLKQISAKPIMSPSGHSIIKDNMKKTGALLGGELSCHFFFHDHYFGYDDGVYAMMRLFQLLENTGKSLDELLQIYLFMYSSPEFRIRCDEDKKVLIVQAVNNFFAQKKNAQINTIDGVRVTMPYGWSIIRASNTQPALTIRFESQTKQGLEHIKEDVIAALSSFYKDDYLKKAFQ